MAESNFLLGCVTEMIVLIISCKYDSQINCTWQTVSHWKVIEELKEFDVDASLCQVDNTWK